MRDGDDGWSMTVSEVVVVVVTSMNGRGGLYIEKRYAETEMLDIRETSLYGERSALVRSEVLDVRSQVGPVIPFGFDQISTHCVN